LHAAGNLTTPLLLIQGLKDTIVPPAQAQAIANALRQGRIPHTYLAFPDEGHGFGASTSIRRALEAELAFYQQALAAAS
jgi:dipeptidyl aminopeptidase/acylaminoacyl peptidase